MPRSRTLERGAIASLATALISCASCAHHEPPTPPGSPSTALPDVPLSPGANAPLTGAKKGAPDETDDGMRADGAANAPVASTFASATPDASSASSEQTHERPVASGTAFAERVSALWSAIVQDAPDAAMPFFFPRSAYEQVKDVGNPDADWKHRLVAAYRRDIHALHAQLGADADRAKLIELDVPAADGRWVEPGEEWNKVGYYRVFGSKLRYDVAGERKAFDVKSLISWRGQWYIVHLTRVR